MRKILLVASSAVLLATLAPVLAGCGSGGRKVSSPSSALLGSWKPADPSGAYIFFSATTATYVPRSGGNSLSVPYEVVDEDGSGQWVDIKYLGSHSGSGGDDTGETFRISFSKDWNRFYLYPASAPEVLEYTYINDREAP